MKRAVYFWLMVAAFLSITTGTVFADNIDQINKGLKAQAQAAERTVQQKAEERQIREKQQKVVEDFLQYYEQTVAAAENAVKAGKTADLARINADKAELDRIALDDMPELSAWDLRAFTRYSALSLRYQEATSASDDDDDDDYEFGD